MKRTLLKTFAAGIAFVGLGVTACTEAPLEPEAIAALDGAGQAYLKSNMHVVQSVSGNGHLVDGTVHRTVTFNIRKRANGTVTGWYHTLARGPGGAHVRVSMECLHVAGNQAWATGTIVAAVNPDNIGQPYSVRFVDGGEGSGAPPDEIGVEAFADYDCTSEPDISMRQLTIGNLQIRG
jgi:hypothetical protein